MATRALEARSRRYDPAETRQRVLDAANMLFSTKGFVGTGTADIARAADVSEGSIFYHFGSKKNLLIELGRMYGERMVAAMHHEGEDMAEIGPELTIARCFAYCEINKSWETVMHGCAEDAPGKMGHVHNPEAEPFYQASREVVVDWVERHLKAVMAKDGRHDIDVSIAASLMYAVAHDALERAFTPGIAKDERDRIMHETIRFIRAATYPAERTAA